MARAFVRSDSDWIGASSAPVTATPCTFACWFQAASIPADGNPGAIMSVSQGASFNNYYMLYLRQSGAGNVSWQYRTSTGLVFAESSFIPTVDVWYPVVMVFAATNNRTLYVGGSSFNNTTAGADPLSVDTVRIGSLRRSSADGFLFDGLVAVPALWDVALTTDEVNDFLGGKSPVLIRRANLQFFAPFRPDDPLREYRDLSLTDNGTAQADDPTGITHPAAMKAGQYRQRQVA